MTMPIITGGWGYASWGGSGWGSGELVPGGPFSVTGAFAPAENVIRLLFTQLPYFSEIYDAYDASDVAHYTVTPVAGSSGWDGNPARPVSPVQVLVSTAQPNALDVYLDRPMSPYPSQYVLAYEDLASASLGVLLPPGQLTVVGLYRRLQPQSEDVVLPTTDLANPQTVSAIQGSGVGAALGPAASLGVFNVDDSGDYAFDAGIQTVKKRILRRGVTDKGAFAHLPATYGVGLLSACKSLSIPSKRDAYAADYAAQIMQEPEVVSASVTAIQDPVTPSLVHFIILAKTRSGTTISLDHPMNTVTGISLANLGA
jgi:hypothetical protein